MSRIQPVDPGAASDHVRALLDKVRATLGVTPNMMKTMAVAPSVLQAYLGFSGGLHGGVLSVQLREKLALLVAESNDCEYCLAAHTAIGRSAGLKPEELLAAREGHTFDEREASALRFAASVLKGAGAVTDEEFLHAKGAGLSDAELVEVVAHVALNVFTNLFNRAMRTDVDFPRAPARQAQPG